MKTKELKATYNLQRFQILQTKLNPSTSNLISDSYAYAWFESLYPILDSSQLHEDLEECFSISKEKINLVSQYADSEWLEKKYYAFYQYEGHFRSRGDIERHDLIVIFRYLFLHGTFDATFWETLIKPMEYPTEASRVISDFRSDYLYLV